MTSSSTRRLFILRGLPGSGKSHYCRHRWPGLTPYKLAPAHWSPVSVSGDHFFETLDGGYEFQLSKLGEAHASAMCDLISALEDNRATIVVDNTHSRHWEYAAAKRLGKAFGYKVEVVDLFDNGLTDKDLAARNIHGVTVEIIAKMRERWEDDT